MNAACGGFGTSIGLVVSVEPEQFSKLVKGKPNSTVVRVPPRWYRNIYQYLFVMDGMVMYAKTKEEIRLPHGTDVIESKHVNLPY